MSLNKKDVASLKQSVKTGEVLGSGSLDAVTNTIAIVSFGRPSEKVSFQADSTFTGTVEFSINGKTWSSTIPAVTAMTTYTTHAVTIARVTCTSGTGSVSFAII